MALVSSSYALLINLGVGDDRVITTYLKAVFRLCRASKGYDNLVAVRD